MSIVVSYAMVTVTVTMVTVAMVTHGNSNHGNGSHGNGSHGNSNSPRLDDRLPLSLRDGLARPYLLLIHSALGAYTIT